MTKQEALRNLTELKQEAEGMSQSECFEDWQKDVEVLTLAIESLKEEEHNDNTRSRRHY